MSSSNYCFVTCIQISQEADKALPKARLVPKKVMVTVWWSAASLIHYSFLNPGETSTSEKYAQQLMKTTIPAASIGQQKGPSSSPQQQLTTFRTINASKVERIGLQTFASSTTFT